jgi:hypothetical protein
MKKALKNRHLILMCFWLCMVPVTIIWLKESVLWLAIMSLYANFESSFAAHEASKENKK